MDNDSQDNFRMVIADRHSRLFSLLSEGRMRANRLSDDAKLTLEPRGPSASEFAEMARRSILPRPRKPFWKR